MGGRAVEVSEELWEVIEPLLPEPPPRRYQNAGRKRIDDRKALTAILFVLQSGIPWEMLPKEMGCSGMTAWRRLKFWQDAGVWEQLHQTLLGRLRSVDGIDFSRVVVDSSSIKAVAGGEKNRPQSNGSRQIRHQASPAH